MLRFALVVLLHSTTFVSFSNVVGVGSSNQIAFMITVAKRWATYLSPIHTYDVQLLAYY